MGEPLKNAETRRRKHAGNMQNAMEAPLAFHSKFSNMKQILQRKNAEARMKHRGERQKATEDWRIEKIR